MKDPGGAEFAARLALIDASPMGATQLRVVLLCFALNVIDGMDVALMTYAAPVIAAEWGLGSGSLGLALTAGLIGMAVGSVGLGRLADLYGRRSLVLTALGLLTVGMVMASMAHSLAGLIVWRIVTGIGIGAILASMAAIASEFANARRRTFWVAFLQAGWPIGAVLTGFGASTLIDLVGWRALFVAAGSASLVFLLIVAVGMPESLQFLSRSGRSDRLPALNRLLAAMGQPPLKAAPAAPRHRQGGWSAVLGPTLLKSTLSLWLSMAMAMASLYFLISWIPKIAVDAGLPLNQAILAGSTFNVGAFVGTVGIGWLAGRAALARLISAALALSVILLLAFGWLSFHMEATFTLILFLGILVQGGFNGLYPAAAQLYPTEIRSSGIGMAMAVGRAGAILGPLAAGYLIQAGIGRGWLFAIYGLPLAVAALSVGSIRSVSRVRP